MGYSFEEHTGEVRLELTAGSHEELFVEAGRALGELMLGRQGEPPDSAEPKQVELEARDSVALLVDWLNELIFLSETSKLVFTRFRVEHASETSVRAVVWGLAPDVLKTAVKAATLHAAFVERTADGWRARVVLDV